MQPSSVVLISFGLLCFLGCYDCLQPHRTCSAVEDSLFGQHVVCGIGKEFAQATLVFPTNFKVEQLDQSVHSLEVTSADHGLVRADYQPLPARRKLVNVMFTNFNLHPSAPRFPLAGLLIHNRRQIQEIHLHQVKLLTLSVKDFRGFYDLVVVKLEDVGLNSVNIDTFAELSIGFVQTAEEADGRYRPKLQELRITGNRNLHALDWSFLGPVAESIKIIDLSNNSLEAHLLTGPLGSSSRFAFQKGVSVNFTRNKINKISSRVYETFQLNRHHEIILASQDPLFCCSCCDQLGFFELLRRNFNIQGQVTCDFFHTQESMNFAGVLPLMSERKLHQYCTVVETAKSTSTAVSSSPVTASSIYVSIATVQKSEKTELLATDPPNSSCNSGFHGYDQLFWLFLLTFWKLRF